MMSKTGEVLCLRFALAKTLRRQVLPYVQTFSLPLCVSSSLYSKLSLRLCVTISSFREAHENHARVQAWKTKPQRLRLP